MTKNPLVNALSAVLYIVGVASVIFYGGQIAGGREDTILAPIALVSLFTLSAAVMAFIFFYQPLQLFVDGKKKAALDLFTKTLAIFAGITLLVFVILFSSII